MQGSTLGVFKRMPGGLGRLVLAENSFQNTPDDVLVPKELVQDFKLVDGVTVSGKSRKENNREELVEIESLSGLSPQEWLNRTPFQQLTAVNPAGRFRFGMPEFPSMRIVELIAPIARGTRGLVVSPPKAGKTYLLQQMAQALHKRDPNCRIIILLIDERPEEVTWFRRSVEAEVIASSSDQSLEEHIELTEFTMAHMKAELECGRNVIVLMDSLTRMGRAFNLGSEKRGRTMSGGLDSRALEIPRRFFGLARNIEGGGSVTILATALIDTNSRMDQLIFEEFKGTGNCEIVLDRSMAEERIFPAIDIRASGTRREELLYEPDEYEAISKLRRMLAGKQPKDAMRIMLQLIEKFETNEELLANV